jgi:hypothetical protein
MRSQNLSPRNLSQNNFWDMETANMAIALGNHHWSQQHHTNAVFHPVTGEEMEYTALMKDPSLQPFWKRGFGNEIGRLFQGIRDITGAPITLLLLTQLVYPFVELLIICRVSRHAVGNS